MVGVVGSSPIAPTNLFPRQVHSAANGLPAEIGLVQASLTSSRKAAARFAMGLIAARPVKPCDGGVFGALNLLLKTKRSAPHHKGAADGDNPRALNGSFLYLA